MSASIEQLTEVSVLTDLAQECGLEYGRAVAQRFPVDGGWRERTFSEVAAATYRVARLLRSAGVRPGDRVALLCATRAEWTICDLAITRLGAVCVPVYPTSSIDQIAWVLQDSGASAVIAETSEHVATVERLRPSSPDLRVVVAVDEEHDGHWAIADVINADGPDDDNELPPVEVREDDPFTIMYTSGTTGNPKGCVLTHRNLTTVLATLRALTEVGRGDVLFAYLPLAHLLTRMLQLFCLRTGATIAYSRGDIRAIIGELAEVAPTHLPSVPTLFEKVYAVVQAQVAARGEDERARFDEAVALGLRVRLAQEAGEAVADADLERFAEADQRVFGLVRAAFGGRIKQAITGAAPIAPEILEFFFACGVPIYEGYGMTESTAVISMNLPGEWRVGTVGRPIPGVDVRIAADGEICARTIGVFAGYWHNEAATAETIVDGWLHTGDLGEFDADGYLRITGRKKDIIITSAGKNLTPANLENDLRRTRLIDQAVMLGDRRPYPVALLTLDAEAVAAWQAANGPDDEALRAVVAADVAEVNARYSPPERIRDFAIVPEPFTIESGELTPTLKIRRAVVAQRHADLVDALYRR